MLHSSQQMGHSLPTQPVLSAASQQLAKRTLSPYTCCKHCLAAASKWDTLPLCNPFLSLFTAASRWDTLSVHYLFPVLLHSSQQMGHSLHNLFRVLPHNSQQLGHSLCAPSTSQPPANGTLFSSAQAVPSAVSQQPPMGHSLSTCSPTLHSSHQMGHSLQPVPQPFFQWDTLFLQHHPPYQQMGHSTTRPPPPILQSCQ